MTHDEALACLAPVVCVPWDARISERQCLINQQRWYPCPGCETGDRLRAANPNFKAPVPAWSPGGFNPYDFGRDYCVRGGQARQGSRKGAVE